MLKRKGQSTLEYALIIAVVVAGLLLMQHYVKGAYSGRLREASDQMGDQYDPTAYSGNFTIEQSSRVNQTNMAGTIKSEHMQSEVNKRSGSESISAWGKDTKLFDTRDAGGDTGGDSGTGTP